MKREGLAKKIIEGSRTRKKGTWQSLVKIAYSWKPCVGYRKVAYSCFEQIPMRLGGLALQRWFIYISS
jgi:hypothetical protein